MENYENLLQKPVEIIDTTHKFEEKNEELDNKLEEQQRQEAYINEVKNKFRDVSAVKPWEKVRQLKSSKLKENNEYGSKYKEKFLFKSRESKFTNVKSRLYRKQENAKKFDGLSFNFKENLAKQRMDLPEDVRWMTDQKTIENLSAFFGPTNEENEKLVRDFAGEGSEDAFELMTNKLMELDFSKIDLANDEDLANNAEMLEKASNMVSSYNELAKTDAFKDKVAAAGEDFQKYLTRLTNISNYYRARKLVITHPYYKTHYNDEITLETKKTDTNDKKVLTELINASLFYAKECQLSGFKSVKVKLKAAPDMAALERKQRQMREEKAAFKLEVKEKIDQEALDNINLYSSTEEDTAATAHLITDPRQMGLGEKVSDYFDEKYGKDFLDRPMMLNVNIGIPGATMGINLRRILESYGKNTDYFSESQYKEMFEKFTYSHRKGFDPENEAEVEKAKRLYNEGLVMMCEWLEDAAYKLKNSLGDTCSKMSIKDMAYQNNVEYYKLTRYIQDINVMVSEIYPYLERQGMKIPKEKKKEIEAIGNYYAKESGLHAALMVLLLNEKKGTIDRDFIIEDFESNAEEKMKLIASTNDFSYAVKDGNSFSEEEVAAYQKKLKSKWKTDEEKGLYTADLAALKKQTIKEARAEQLNFKEQAVTKLVNAELKKRDEAAGIRLSVDLNTKMKLGSAALNAISSFLTKENKDEMIDLYLKDKKAFFEKIEDTILKNKTSEILKERLYDAYALVSDDDSQDMEKVSAEVAAFEKLRALNPEYQVSKKVDRWIKDVSVGVKKYRIKKLILKNPYYRSHTESEIYNDFADETNEAQTFYRELTNAYERDLTFEQIEELEWKARGIPDQKTMIRAKVSKPDDAPDNGDVLLKKGAEQQVEDDEKSRPALRQKIREKFTFGENGAYNDNDGTNFAFLNEKGEKVMGFNAEIARDKNNYSGIDFLTDNEILEMYDKLLLSRRKDYDINNPEMVEFARKEYLEGMKMYSDMTLAIQSRMVKSMGNLLANMSPADVLKQVGDDYLNLHIWIQNINYNFKSSKGPGLLNILKENGMKTPSEAEQKERDVQSQMMTDTSTTIMLYCTARYQMNNGESNITPENEASVKMGIKTLMDSCEMLSKKDYTGANLKRKMNINDPSGQQYLKSLEEVNKTLDKNSIDYAINKMFIDKFKKK